MNTSALRNLASTLVLTIGLAIPQARAHNLDQQDTSIAFDKATLDMMAARTALNQPLIQAGDSVGLILKSTPGPGTATGAGGYMTFYIPPGTQVEKADYGRPVASGGFTVIPMKGPSIMAVGDGSVGSATTATLIGLNLGPNAAGITSAAVSAAGVHNGTLAGVYGDVGVFYSTDPQTVWQSFASLGGYDRNVGTSDNILTNNRGEAKVPITRWDGEQLIAFGLSSPSAPIIDPNGRGNSPWGMASAVAGPESGYKWAFDWDYYLANASDPNRMKNSVVTGPWNRIQHVGSTIAKDQVGLKSSALGFATADASTLGTAVSPGTPLPPTVNWSDNTSPKAVRFSYGGLVLGQSEYARVQLKILAAPGQPNSPFDANGCFFMNTDTFGGDAGGEQGGKDHLWRYYDPTTQTINPCAMLQKQFAKTPLAPGEASYFELAVINTGTTAMNNVVISDPMPSGLTYVSAVPAPSSTAPLTFTLGTVPAQGFVKIRVNFTATGSGTIFNTATMTSSAGTTSAMDSVDVGIRSLLEPTKSVTPSTAAPGSTVAYTIAINNVGTGSNGTPLVVTEVLPAGFTYSSFVSAQLNGAAAPSGVVTVNSADATKPVFTVSQGIQAGKSLLVTFNALISASQASGTYGNAISMNYEGKVVTSGSLAPVTVGGGKIGDTIFRDWDGDGIQDATDEGISGVVVQLWSDPNGDGNTADGTMLQTKTTDSNGQYTFTGLTAANYVVKIPTPPAGYTQTADPQGALDNAAKLTLTFNQEVNSIDFGYAPAGAGSIGDTVFEDIGNDGTLSGGDPGIGGITVNLYEDTNGNGTVDVGDALIATTVTDVNGNYLFSSLAVGLNYIARVDSADPDLAVYFTPESYEASTPVSKSVNSLAGDNLTADFGFWRAVPATLGDKVFVDTNGNGIFDGADTGIPAVGVKLYSDTDGNGIADPSELVSTVQTDINGNYLFTNLGAGDYIAVLDTADTDLPGGLTPTTAQFAVTLDPGENDLTADFPLVSIFSKSVDKATANPTDTLNYTIVPRWPNSDLLTNARVTDLVPTGTSFLTAGQGGTHSSGTVTWNLGTNTPGTIGHAGEIPQTIVLGDLTAETIGDTFINQDKPDENKGTDNTMLISCVLDKHLRSLIKWDISGVPAGAIITGAKMKFTVTTAKSQTATVRQVTTAWDEGAGNAADGADWTKADDNPDVLWTTAGGDYIATDLASFSMATTGQKTLSTAGLTALVQAWVNGTANNGVIIGTNGTAGIAKIATSEDNTAARRPILEISYLSTAVTMAPAIAAADTFINQDRPTENKGGDATFSILDDAAGNLLKDMRGVVQWSTAGIPAGATIVSAELKFNVDTNKTFLASVHPLTKTWNELQATWNIPATAATWTSVGAEGDYGASLGTIDLSTKGYKSVTGTSVKDLVQGWVDSPTTNKGVLLKYASGTLGQTAKISSSEDTGLEPLLLVTYELPTTDTTIAATGTLVTGSGAQTVTVAMNVAMGGNSTAKTVTAPASLTPAGVSVGAITKITGPAPASQIIPAGGGTATFTYTYTVVPGANPGSVTFTGSASGAGAAYVGATSNSVLVSPPLTFQVTVSGPPALVGAVSNVAVFQDDNVISPTNSPEVLTALSGSIGDLIWADLDGDGVRDPGEPGLSGVQVCATNGTTTLCDTTDGNGNYRIFNLGADTWTVSVNPATIPAGYTGTTATPLVVALAANQQYADADFGLRPPPDPLVASSIGDILWLDANENGVVDPAETLLANITVKLYSDINNNGVIDGGDILTATTSTDSAGVYTFGGLYAGNYLVDVDETDPQFPAGVELVSGGANGSGLHDVTLAAATNVTVADFGYNYSGSIGDYLWYDLNGDKIQNNAGDGGPIPNAVVTLYQDENSNGYLDAGELIVGFTTTDINGAYLFDNLAPGDYMVKVEEQEVLAPPSSPFAGEPARMQASTGTKKAVTLAPGQDYTAADFGFLEVAKIEGYVFWDANSNSVRDPGETTYPNVTVTLNGTDANGAPVSMTTTTNASGEYKFLPPSGTYTVAYNTADTDIPAALGTQTTPVSFLFSITSGNEVENLDFGVDNTGSIGDTIFANPNSNATQDSGESGLANVVVNLFSDAARTLLLDSKVTDSSGKYLFTGLADGTYYTQVDTVTLPAGYTTIPTADPDATKDSLGTATIAGGSSVLTQDFGYTSVVPTFTVSGTIFDDLNTSGTPNVPGEQLAGVTVTAVVTTGAVTQTFTTTTDSNGLYTFAGIPTGSNVTVTVSPATLGSPAYVQTVDPDGALNNTTTITNVTANQSGKNFGYVEQLGSIAGTVVKGDGDGLAESGEPVQTGVTVTLIYAGIDGIEGTADDGTFTALTNGTGDYSFTNLLPGNYSLSTAQPVGFAPLADADGTHPNSIALALSVGQNKLNQDFEYQAVSISDYVWNDADGDGNQDANELPLANVRVYVDVDGDNSYDVGEPTDTTDASGLYLINGLSAGTLSVRVDTTTLPAGVTATYDLDGTSTLHEASVVLAANQDRTDVDFGYQGNASIGDYIWNDADGDGVQDASEFPISGVKVFIDLNTNGTPEANEPSAITSSTGAYTIGGLAPGTYTVVIDPATKPAGTTVTGDPDATKDGKTTVTLAAGQTLTTADFGLQGDASVGDYVWNDADGDGTQDATELPISGVKVFIDLNADGVRDANEPFATTSSTGAYTISGLVPGTYTVVLDPATTPAGTTVTGDPDATKDGKTTVTLAAGQTLTTADFGLQGDASVGDYVWNDADGDGVQDGGELPLSGVKVFIDRDADGVLDANETFATTNGSGAYTISGLVPGTYTVVLDPLTLPSGSVVTGDPDPTVDGKTTVTLLAGQSLTTADFGLQSNTSIGNYVWIDADGDGVQDAAELPLSGVRVYIDTDGDDTYDLGEPTATTNASGLYTINGLPAATYQVRVDTTTLPAGMTQTYDLDGTGTPHEATATLAANQVRTDVDFGYQGDASIGDYVWNDADGDGVQDVNEVPLPGVVVFVDRDADGLLDANEPFATTDAAGAYTISNLAPGTYTVAVDMTTLPAGVTQTGDPDATKDHKTSVTLTAGQTLTTADFGYQGDASISDYVWNDADGDGVQDANELPLSGVVVFVDLDNDGLKDANEPSTMTNASGAYAIGGLVPGTYTVVLDPATQPAGTTVTGDPDATKDGKTSVTLVAGQTLSTADFGLQGDASVGDYVWNDADGDGVQDASELPISGVKVFIDLNANGTPEANEPSAITSSTGAYTIGGLVPGTYTAAVDTTTLPAGVTQTGDPDATKDHKTSVTLTAGQTLTTADFGYQGDASISDYVWNDADGDGVQDASEQPLSGVKVFIDLNANGTPEANEPSVITSSTGAYTLGGLVPGTYTVAIDPATKPAGTTVTGDPDATKDGKTTVTLVAGQTLSTADFGLQGDASVGDYVWNDADGDGVQDGSEQPLSGVKVFIDLNANGTPEANEPSTITSGSGAYTLGGLVPGTYTVAVDTTTLPAGATRTFDLDGIASANKATLSLAAGDARTDADFGYQSNTYTVSGTIRLDSANDNTLGGDEPGLPGVLVSLRDSNGDVIATTVTDSLGNYSFPGILPGTYSVVETDPAGATSDDDVTGSNTDNTNAVLITNANVTGMDFLDSNPTLSDISGFVYDDGIPNDNTFGAGDSPVGGVTVSLYKDLNSDGNAQPGELIDTTTTATNGSYAFTNLPDGSYLVVETNPAGATSEDDTQGSNTDDKIAVALAGADSAGNNFLDDGVSTYDISGQVTDGTNPIPGVTITLLDGSGNPIATTTTDSTGAYTFPNLVPGSYTVVETNPAGTTGGSDVDGGNPDQISVTITNADVPGRDFVDTIPPTALNDISGFVYDDGIPNDNTFGAGDSPVGGVTVSLYKDLNSDGNAQPGELIDTTTTATDGSYAFTNLPDGAYLVVETNPAGATSEDDTQGSNNDDKIAVALAGADSAGNNFLDDGVSTYVVSGTVRNDTANDNTLNGNEPGIPGVTVSLRDSNGNVIATTITDSNGNYTFPSLVAGTYSVVETDPAGATSDDDVTGSNTDNTNAVVITNANVTGQDFLDSISASALHLISGQVRDDFDADGILSDTDSPVGGVTVRLYSDVNGNRVVDAGDVLIATTLTNSSGYYLFSGLPDSRYIVQEVDPVGANSTGDTGGSNDNIIPVIIAGASSTGNDFLDAVDPAGYAYSPATGQIIPGGSISVSGPGAVTILMDGSSGQYSWITDGTPGTYTMTYSPPLGYIVDPTRGVAGASFDPTGGADPTLLGSSENPGSPGFLTDFTSGANPYYLTFVLAPGDPFIINNNIPIVETKPASFVAWQYANPLGGQNGATQDPDGDGVTNLEEFAYCFSPTSGLNTGCPLEITRNPDGTLDARLRRVIAATGITYALEYIATLTSSAANGSGWTTLSTIVPTTTPNGDGTETVLYHDLASMPALSTGTGFIRPRLTLAAGGSIQRGLTVGWSTRSLDIGCQTCENPFLNCEIFSGLVGSVTASTLDFTASAGGGSIAARFVTNTEYYLEIVSGDNLGHRFDIDESASTASSIVIDTASPRNTLGITVPAALAADRAVIRAHHTTQELFAPAEYTATGSPGSADRLLFHNRSTSSFEVLWLYSNGGSPIWVTVGDATLTDAGSRIIGVCEGFYVHPKGSAHSLVVTGLVRQNALACPLVAGANLIGNGWPLDMTPTTRKIILSDGFTGSTRATSADRLQFWKGDENAAETGYHSHFLLNSVLLQQWVRQADATLTGEDASPLFKSLHSSFIQPQSARPNLLIPLPWTP